MKDFINKNLGVLIVTISSLLVIWPLFVPGYFSHHDNLQVIRIFEMRKCFGDLQIPCRWVPDMGYGNGQPLFNFYGPLAYYIGGLASYLIGYIGAAKLLFLIPLVAGGVGMYLLASELYGKNAGIVAGILYLFAPYRALDAFVRGAIGESFALSLVPFVFYFVKKKKFVWSTVFLSLFLLSHNIMTLLFTPLIIMWAVYWAIKDKNLKLTIISICLAFGISAFFLMPAFLEKNLIQTQGLTTGELDFRAQFVKVSQLFFDKHWSYGASSPLSKDTISYQIGWPHWWLVVLSFFVFLFYKNEKNRVIPAFIFLVFLFSIFMTHNKSAPIWEIFKILSFVQFPWRFLGISIFSSSLLGGYFVSNFKNSIFSKILIIFIVITTILFNWRYFRPKDFYYDLNDNALLTGQSFIDQQGGAVSDYLPLKALEPKEVASNTPVVKDGKAFISSFTKKSNYWRVDVDAQKVSTIEVPVFYFPNWIVNYPQKIGTIGRIAVEVPAGKSTVIGKFKNTPIRLLGNILSIGSLLIFIFYAKNRKNNI